MTGSATPAAGQVADGDVWYRALTNIRHFKGGHVHHSALKKWIDIPEAAGADWKAELSGRLRSIDGDVAADGQRRADQQRANAIERGQRGAEFQFVAVLYVRASEVRAWTFADADVVFERKDYDAAHANIVFKKQTPVEVLPLLDDLVSALHVAAANDIETIPSAEGGAPTTTSTPVAPPTAM